MDGLAWAIELVGDGPLAEVPAAWSKQINPVTKTMQALQRRIAQERRRVKTAA
jgi:hypothetical protein